LFSKLKQIEDYFELHSKFNKDILSLQYFFFVYNLFYRHEEKKKELQLNKKKDKEKVNKNKNNEIREYI